MPIPPPEIISILERTGFIHAVQIRKFRVDGALISALVERWRPQTHTFHLPTGECTVTLEDVAVQLGLPIEGECIHRVGDFTVDEICLELLGRVPRLDLRERGKGKVVANTWLRTIYSAIPDDPTEIQLEQCARA